MLAWPSTANRTDDCVCSVRRNLSSIRAQDGYCFSTFISKGRQRAGSCCNARGGVLKNASVGFAILDTPVFGNRTLRAIARLTSVRAFATGIYDHGNDEDSWH